MAFNEAQRRAVDHFTGPAMVLAGPGSGKTTVITHRVKALIEERGVDPGSILVITFTKAAAMEMKERFDALTGKAFGRVSFGTFHAVFFQILKLAYRYQASDIIRDEERTELMRQLTERENMELEDPGEFISAVLAEIGSVKGEMMSLDHYYSKNCSEEIFKRLYDGYERGLRARGRIDFDDMLVMCHELFSQRADILAAWQRKYRFILIDEFQDINKVQYQVVRMLAGSERNLFIVGDDDQSIYRFRGARPEIMLGFERDFPGAERILLDINYRSTREIVDAAMRLISRNRTRFPKEIKAAKGRGKPVAYCLCRDPGEENRRVADELMQYHRAGYEWREMAVLYRTNLGPRFLIERLMEYNIPFRAKDAVPNLFEHWIAGDIFAYIRAAMGDRSRAVMLRMINRPKRYVSRDAMEDPQVDFEKIKSFYQDKDWMVERLEDLEGDLKAISRMSPLAAVNYIRKAVGYDDYLREYAQYRRMDAEELLETAEQLKESGSAFKTFDQWFDHVKKYSAQLKEQASRRQTGEDALTLSTMHSSKGLEYRVVYIIDADEGVTPHGKAVLDADLEEERRLFYVAMTRAKERLHIMSTAERYHRKAEVSRFVGEAEPSGKAAAKDGKMPAKGG